jgi:hypothetical protein
MHVEIGDALLKPLPIGIKVALRLSRGSCSWNCCVKAAPHWRAKPLYSDPASFGVSNTLMPRLSERAEVLDLDRLLELDSSEAGAAGRAPAR